MLSGMPSPFDFIVFNILLCISVFFYHINLNLPPVTPGEPKSLRRSQPKGEHADQIRVRSGGSKRMVNTELNRRH